MTVSVNQFKDANGVSWEGVGITLDLRVKNDRADVDAGRDRVLETAVDFPRAGAVRPRGRSVQEPKALRNSE